MVFLGSAVVLYFAVLNWLGYRMVVQPPIYFEEIQYEIISPLPEETATPSATPKVATRGAEIKKELQIVKHVEAKEPEVRTIQGEASYYSRAGCLGCSENMIMANGEALDDTALTLALTPEMVNKYKLLNDLVTVENVKTGKTVRAKVTDTGGFGRLNRVADLSMATRDAINCNNLCEVKITY